MVKRIRRNLSRGLRNGEMVSSGPCLLLFEATNCSYDQRPVLFEENQLFFYVFSQTFPSISSFKSQARLLPHLINDFFYNPSSKFYVSESRSQWRIWETGTKTTSWWTSLHKGESWRGNSKFISMRHLLPMKRARCWHKRLLLHMKKLSRYSNSAAVSLWASRSLPDLASSLRRSVGVPGVRTRTRMAQERGNIY